jgi:hypothetical protein
VHPLLSCLAAPTETQQFTVENDLITPTFKLKRPQLQRLYQAQVDKLYASLRGDSRFSSYAPSLTASRAASRNVSSAGKADAAVELPKIIAKAL